eukprot:439615-Heterocapsa_arctica.AAC.1
MAEGAPYLRALYYPPGSLLEPTAFKATKTTIIHSLFLNISLIAIRPPTAIFKGSRCQNRTRDAQ